jgi:hypothetical protein
MIRILHDLSSVCLLGRVRHGDRARGSEPAHLRGRDLKGSAAMLPGPVAAYARFRQFFSVLVSRSVPMAWWVLSYRETNEY